jgi:hypothetical protein
MEGFSPFGRLLGFGVGDVRSGPDRRLLQKSPDYAPKKTRVKSFIKVLSQLLPLNDASHFPSSRSRNLRRSPFYPVSRERHRLPRRRLYRLSLSRKLLTPNERRYPSRNLCLCSQR